MVSAAPPLDGSTVKVTPEDVTEEPVTFVPNLKDMPCFVNVVWNTLAISASTWAEESGRIAQESHK